MKLDLRKRFDKLNLPSEGFFYKDKRDHLLVRFLEAHHEYILSSQMLMDSKIGIDLVLSDVILDDIDMEELLLCDYQAIGIFLRATTYGNEIDNSVKCQKCGKENNVSVKLSEMSVKKTEIIPDADGLIQFNVGTNVFKISQVKKKDITSQKELFVEGINEKNIRRERTQSVIQAIYSINEIESKEYIQNFVMGMRKIDFDMLHKNVHENQILFDNKVLKTCDHCGEDFQFSFSIGGDILKLPEEYQMAIDEECFLLNHYSQGGISLTEALDTPVIKRKWMIARLEKEYKKKREAEQAAQRKK